MSYSLIVKPEAEYDLMEAALWYQQQLAGLGDEFLNSVEKKLITIENNPLLFPVIYNHIHQALLHRFPFAIHYTIEQETIYILAITHTSRNPTSWQKREK